MELGGGGGGKGNAITTTTTIISTKNLEVVVKPHTNPDPEAKTGSDPSPVKKVNQKQAKYRECQKNHAVSTGGHVVDGCCEFMSGGEEGTLDALKCAACKCHRSFHRKEVYGHRNNNTAQEMVTPAFYCSSSSYKAIQPRGSVLYPTGEIGRRRSNSSSSEDMKNGNNKELMMRMMMRKKKRVRTKINEEQKEKMKEFAERLGWRMLKKDEEEIDKFCKLENLRRQVFKVWMHNNKQAMKRRNCNTSSDVQNLN